MISDDVKFFDYSSINVFLAQNSIWIKNNPCISPDFCLDWNRFTEALKGTAELTEYSRSTFSSEHGNGSWLRTNGETMHGDLEDLVE
jgi:hypothetical protein